MCWNTFVLALCTLPILFLEQFLFFNIYNPAGDHRWLAAFYLRSLLPGSTDICLQKQVANFTCKDASIVRQTRTTSNAIVYSWLNFFNLTVSDNNLLSLCLHEQFRSGEECSFEWSFQIVPAYGVWLDSQRDLKAHGLIFRWNLLRHGLGVHPKCSNPLLGNTQSSWN